MKNGAELRVLSPERPNMGDPRPRTLLFDLDGTLFDSTDLLLAGYKHATRAHLDQDTSDDDWWPHFGRPLRVQMAAFSEEHADAMTATYRTFYSANHDAMLRLYEGVPEMLAHLKSAGFSMGVVTSKGSHVAERGLALLGIRDFFSVVIGEDDVHLHKPDPAPVLMALNRMGARPAGAWMIGDSPYDIQAGRAAGCRTAAVLWGPFSRESLAVTNPTAFADSPAELISLLKAG